MIQLSNIKKELESVSEKQYVRALRVVKQVFDVDENEDLIVALHSLYVDSWEEKSQRAFDYTTNGVLDIVSKVNDYTEEEFVNELAKVVTGFELSYWADNKINDFEEILRDTVNRLHEYNPTEGLQEGEMKITIESSDGNPIISQFSQGVIDYSIVQREDLELPAKDLFEKYTKENTRLLAMTLASNLTGRIVFREDVFEFFHDKGIITFIDSSQGAGKIRLSMKAMKIDFLAFTGHKDLMAIPGVGGLCCESSEHFEPLVQGGTGIHGEEYTNPDIFPEGYEAGTLNMPAIWSIHASINYLTEHFSEIAAREKCLMKYLLDGLKEINSVTVYDEDSMRVATCSINVEGISSDKLVALLDTNGVCVRGGIHCAIIAHEAIGTVSTGTVRLSLNYMNTEQEIDTVLDILRNVGE